MNNYTWKYGMGILNKPKQMKAEKTTPEPKLAFSTPDAAELATAS